MLSYSSRPKRRWRRVLLRRVMPLLIVFLIGWAVFANRSELAFRAQRIYWGWRCARHVTPAGTVLLESDPQKASELLKHHRDYVQNGMQWAGMYLGMALVSKTSVSPAIQAAYWPEDFRRYLVLTDQGPEHGLTAIAFMGERRSADGHRRLVVIPFGVVNALRPETELSQSFVLPLPGWLGGFEPMRSQHRLLQGLGSYRDMHLQPGVADPSDSSHISLGYQDGDQRGFIDVFLLDDDTLLVKRRGQGAQ